MLRILREHASSWMLKAILIVVALSFVLFFGGYSYFKEKKETYVAKVNRVTIEWREYNDAFQNTIKQYQQALGPAFSEKMIDELRLREKILDDLIKNILILQEAKRLGLSVSDAELREVIESIPVFQVNGQFDTRRYEWALRSNRMTSEQFEQNQRENLLIFKIVNLIKMNGGKVSEEEVLDTYLFENERINLTFVKVAPGALKSQVSANEIEVKDYYQRHQEEFRIPTFIQVQYLLFRPADFERNVRVSPDDIKRYYDSRKDTFTIPKQVRVRDILIKAGPQDTPDRLEAKKKKVDEILEKAKKTKDFGSLAKQYSEAETASRGGDMGWIQKGMLGKQLESILFSMKAGDLSGVLATGDGFHIFKIEEVKEEKQEPFGEVKDQILQTLKKEKAKAEASRKADDAFYSLFKSRDLEGYSKEKNVPIKTTGLFKEGDEVPDMGRNPLFYSSAFSLRLGEISPVVNVPPNFYVLKLVNKKDSRIPPLDEVKEEVKEERQKPFGEVKDQILQTLKKEKAKAEASRKADDAFYSLFRSRDLEGYSKEKNIPIKTTGFFKEGDEVADMGRHPLFYSSAFSLRLGEISPVVNTPPNFYLLKLVNKKDSRIPPLDEVKEAVRRKVVEMKAEEKARQVAEDFLNQIRTGKNNREAVREKGYPLEETGFFTRAAGVVPKVGPAREFMGTLASLTEKNPVPKEAIRTKDGYFVVRLSGYEPADQSKFQSVKKNLEKRLSNQKQEGAFQNWVDQLRSKAKIDINKDLLKG